MAALFTGSKFSATDANGNPLAGGKVFTYAAGTLTPKATYTTQAGNVANANPVILDSTGRADIWLGTGSYKFVVQDSTGAAAPDGTVDNITAPSLEVFADLASTTDAADGAGLIGFSPSLNYAAGTIGWWDRNAGVSMLRFMPISTWAAIAAGTNTEDLTSYVQAAFAAQLTGGFELNGHGYTYKCNSAVTWQRSSVSHTKRLAAHSMTLDFSGMGTSGSALTVGATSTTYFLEDGRTTLRNVTLIGPEDIAPQTNAPTGSTVGLDLQFCGGVTLDAVNAFGFYNACHVLFCFPVKAINCNFRRSWIGLHIDEAANLQEWDGLTLPNCRYGILVKAVSTSLDSGKINNLKFRRPWFEGSAVGMVIDSGSGGSGATPIRSIYVENPYCALMTYDFFRVGTVWTLATPETRGANCSEFVGDFSIRGGLFNPIGGLFSATQALVAFDSTTRCSHFDCDVAATGLRLDADTFVNAPASGVAVTRGYPGTSDRVTDAVYWNGGAVVRRLLPDGTVMVGAKATASTVAEIGVEVAPGGYLYVTRSANPAFDLNRTTSDGTIANFRREGTAVGSIGVTASATSFNTSSDYRLKDNVSPRDGALALAAVNSWPIRSFTWKSTGVDAVGVLAHELQAVKPDAVTGAKDGDEMQGVDYSKLVPDLVAAVQYLAQRVNALEA